MQDNIIDGWTPVTKAEPEPKQYLSITLRYEKSILNNIHNPSVKNLIVCEFIDALEQSLKIRNENDNEIDLLITF